MLLEEAKAVLSEQFGEEVAKALLAELTLVHPEKMRLEPFPALEQAMGSLMAKLRSIYEQRLGTLRNNEILLNFVSSVAMPSPSAGTKLGPVGDRALVTKR